MEGVWTGNLVWHTRNVGSIVVSVTRTVVAICEYGEIALGVRRRDLGSRPHIVQRLLAGIELQINRLFLGAACTFGARVTAARVVVDCGMIRNRAGAHVNWQLTLHVGLVLVLVPAVTALALGVVRFGLACAATVFALFDRAAFGVDVV